MDTFNAGFHRGEPGAPRVMPRALYETTLISGDGPFKAAEAFAETLPASEKAQGQIVLHRVADDAIFVYSCTTSYIPERIIPEQITRTVKG